MVPKVYNDLRLISATDDGRYIVQRTVQEGGRYGPFNGTVGNGTVTQRSLHHVFLDWSAELPRLQLTPNMSQDTKKRKVDDESPPP